MGKPSSNFHGYETSAKMPKTAVPQQTLSFTTALWKPVNDVTDMTSAVFEGNKLYYHKIMK